MFPNAGVECLSTTSSDHYPPWLTCKPVTAVNRNPQRFKFENVWLAEPDFKQQVYQRWKFYLA